MRTVTLATGQHINRIQIDYGHLPGLMTYRRSSSSSTTLKSVYRTLYQLSEVYVDDMMSGCF